MLRQRHAKGLLRAAQVVLLVGATGACVLLTRSVDWHPLELYLTLLALALVAERFDLEIRGQRLSASLIALVLAMSLLGPAPAVSIGLAAMTLNSAMRRLSRADSLVNLSAIAAHTFVGSMLIRVLAGDIHDPRNASLSRSVTFALIVLAVFWITNAVGFLQIALEVRVTESKSLRRQIREVFVPMQPGQLAMGVLAALLAVAYTNLGFPAMSGAIIVLLLFQYLMRALLKSEDRADSLEARSIQLVRLQLGVLRTLVRALEMRDPTTSRHATAVAGYARALAREAKCDLEEQEVVHTAALLHEIGKFTWPDRILQATEVTDHDETIIKRHPQDGAMLVGALDGYGPVADAILYHHERTDGRGYPAGLIGSEIPRASRILAICSTYDTMTSGDGYRTPMTTAEAAEELRVASASGQLDPDLTELFIAVLDRDGGQSVRDSRGFDEELEFERRVREMATPRT